MEDAAYYVLVRLMRHEEKKKDKEKGEPPCMEDIEIVKRVKNGETEAFSILVERYHRNLLNFVFKLLGDEELVEDIGQEVFFKAYTSIKTFDETRGAPFSAWLFMIARNRCKTELRKRRGKQHTAIDTIPELTAQDRTGEEKLLEDECREILEASLVQLPEPYKDIIIRSLEGDPMEKIARAECISLGTVKSRSFRAREKMKRFIQKYFGGWEHEHL